MAGVVAGRNVTRALILAIVAWLRCSSSFFSEKIPHDVPGLLKLIEKINQVKFVQITVGSQADAFTLFESLGIAIEDLFAAEYVVGRARESGRGTELEF